MAFSRLTRWWRRAKPPAAGDEWKGNEFGWALREIAGEGRHPNRTTTPPHQKHPSSPPEPARHDDGERDG
jgi:hypothetical protein